jgi:hypothetical protein
MVGFDQWKRCSFWFGGELIEKKKFLRAWAKTGV